MVSKRFALEILALYAIAAAGCHDDASSPAVPDGGRADRDAGRRAADAGPTADASTVDGGPDNKRPNVGDVCDAGVPGGAARTRCADARIDWMQRCKQRFEGTQCYVRTDGAPCLPANDPKLVDNLVDYIRSAGFQAEFVIADAPGVEVPESCNALLDCCAGQTVDYLRKSCYDDVDNPERHPYCSKPSAPFNCPSPDADAGTPSTSHASLCCYKTCGYIVDT